MAGGSQDPDSDASPGSGSQGASSDTGDASVTTSDVASIDSSNETSATCPMNHVCVADVPDGWDGPHLFWEAGLDVDQPECPADTYPMEVLPTIQRGFNVPDESCFCTCLENFTCSGSAVDLTLYEDPPAGAEPCPEPPVFDNPLDRLVQQSPACRTGIPSERTNRWWRAPPAEFLGNCSGTSLLRTASFELQTRFCGGVQDVPGCDVGEVCVPRPLEPFDEQVLCVRRVGETLECPPGYPARHQFHQGLIDSRRCSDCGCLAEGDCSGTVQLFAADGCAGSTVVNFEADGECQQVPIFVRSARWLPGSANVQCVADPESPPTLEGMGIAAPTDPVTVCCTLPV